MTETSRIDDQLRRAFEGDAWHGPALKEILSEVTAQKAAIKPIRGLHSIWEIVLHLSAWMQVVRRRLEGEVVADLPPEEDWPAVRDTGKQAWTKCLEDLEGSYQGLRQKISQLEDARLEETVAGKGYTVYVMLHGAVQHNLYHAGQIALLKKAR
ncbi:MAG: DinB family protein [Acidobacteriia bacterium]|nr:DinB family protein [Terriglobia bacterium]